MCSGVERILAELVETNGAKLLGCCVVDGPQRSELAHGPPPPSSPPVADFSVVV